MPAIAFDRFYRYAELTAILQAFAAENPELVSIESIGKSHEGRDIWVLTVTSAATGPAAEKPAFWVDGNIHSTEVAASVAVLYFLQTLVTQYGKDPDVTRALDTRAFYVCPRFNPDGAEWALADKPKWVRSSTRPYPWDEDEIEGLTVEDIDGDGRILQMRIPDSNGLWKDHPEQPGLMVRRDPIETGGRYYRILPEGTMEAWDGFMLRVKKNKQGLDLNRNFPANWRQEFEQLGAGPFPTSEPEVRAVVSFFVRHTNITGGVAFHTWAGVLLRPFDHLPDGEMNAEDLWHYRRTGDKGTELTGYPAISVYEEFRYHPKQVIGGVFDWVYDHLGMYSWVVEIWSPMREAGITNYKYIDWFRDHPIADDLKLYRWNVDKLGRHRAHSVETVRPSAARPRRDRRLEPLPRVRQSAAGVPRARGRALPEVAPLAGADLAEDGDSLPRPPRPSATIIGGCGSSCRTPGWLPSYVSKRALERKVVRGVIAEIALPAGREARFTASAAKSWASSKARRTSTRACRSGPITTSPTIAPRSNGSCRGRRATRCASLRGTSARAPSAPA